MNDRQSLLTRLRAQPQACRHLSLVLLIWMAIYIPFNGHWKESLRIPISDVMRMSPRPLKWLRFLCYIILNSTGHVYRDMYAADMHEPGTEEDYDAPVTSSEYYYLPGWLFFSTRMKV